MVGYARVSLCMRITSHMISCDLYKMNRKIHGHFISKTNKYLHLFSIDNLNVDEILMILSAYLALTS